MKRERWQAEPDGEGASVAEAKWLDGMKWKSRRERFCFLIALRAILFNALLTSIVSVSLRSPSHFPHRGKQEKL